MPLDLSDKLVVAVSSRVLFDLRKEDDIYRTQGLDAFVAYQLLHQNDFLEPGTVFYLVESLLELNKNGIHTVEVLILSQNHPAPYTRVQNSIRNCQLPISRAILTGGEPLADYAKALKVDLFLSADPADVQNMVKEGFAAGLVYPPPDGSVALSHSGPIRIAFDGDGVLFDGEAEAVNKHRGLRDFHEHEDRNSDVPLPDGPFATLLRKLSSMQQSHRQPFRLALVTARNAPADQRAIKTIRGWGVALDTVAFLGGLPKTEVLRTFRPHIFFDDTKSHCDAAATVVSTALVPNPTPSDARVRFLESCSLYTEKPLEQLAEFEAWYRTKLAHSTEALQLRFVARFEESRRGTAVGLDRRSRGKKDTKTNKLVLYLDRLLLQLEKHDDVE